MMAKYYGSVGYVHSVETKSCEWENVETERKYQGDVIRYTRRYQSGEKVNDDVTLNNRISIIADPYAFNNLSYIRYVTFVGTKWKVTDVEVQYPRLILTIGGVYNGSGGESEESIQG